MGEFVYCDDSSRRQQPKENLQFLRITDPGGLNNLSHLFSLHIHLFFFQKMSSFLLISSVLFTDSALTI